MDSQNIPQVVTQKKSHKALWIVLITFFVLILCAGSCVGLWLLALSIGDPSNTTGSNSSKALETETVLGDSKTQLKLLSIPINGPILNTKATNDFLSFTMQVTYGYEIKDILIKAAKDSEIKGILLEINSPGGTITGSKAISDGVEYYRAQTGNPVYAHIMGMGASGAYWSAASADYIYSDYGSLVGSIGVILGPFKYYNNVLSEEGITTKDGIETYYITSGTSKDVGSSNREMSAEELKVLQAGTDSAYKIFVDYVSKQRSIPAEKIKKEIKAMPYSEQQALDFKLIDKIGSLGDAITALADKASLQEGSYQLVRVKTSTDFWSLLLGGDLFKSLESGISAKSASPLNELNGKMLYLYNDQQYLK